MFRQVSNIPRPSKKEEKIRKWLEQFARRHSLKYRSDKTGNIVMQLPATAGLGHLPGIILQSHMDMVCQKRPDSKHDFTKDPIAVIEKDGWLCADGTTLGADNGIGMAMALALVGDDSVAHGPLELLFTVDEETGLTGANGLEDGFIDLKRLLNLDSEEDSFTVGCAGGEQTDIILPVKWQAKSARLGCFRLRVGNLRGGHSGVEIHEQRANAIKLTARTLATLAAAFKLHIVEISGGSAHNAIPRDVDTLICFDARELETAGNIIAELTGRFKSEFRRTDTGLKIELQKAALSANRKIMSVHSTGKLIALLLALPYGVHRISHEFESVVETSSNVAVIKTDRKKNTVTISTSQRSLKESCLDAMTATVTAVANLASAEVKTKGRYPGWEPSAESKLLEKCVGAYERLNGRKPTVRVIHAGLECGLIGKKFAGMDMVSFGPTIENAHSPQEKLNIESVDKSWQFLTTLLSGL